MPESYQYPTDKSSSKRSFPVNLRVLAVLVMVAGAAAFFAVRIFLGDQPLILLLPTLVTFAGLGLVIYARRTQGPMPEVSSTQTPQLSRRSVPPGLRPRGSQAQMRQAARPNLEPVYPQPVHEQTIPDIIPQIPLLERAVVTFASQGAQVERTALRAGRGMLSLTTADGRQGLALVLADSQVVTMADVRGLAAMIQHSHSTFGYLIAEGSILPEAADWAMSQSPEGMLSLVSAAQLAEVHL